MTLPVLAPASAASRRRSNSRAGSWRPPSTRSLVVLGQKHPGEGDVLVLVQVAEVVIGGEPTLAHPAERFGQLTRCHPHARPQGGDRSDVGRVTSYIQALCLIEQLERRAWITLSLPHSGHRHGPPMPVLRQTGILAQFGARQQMLPGRIKVVVFREEQTHAHMHVRRAAQVAVVAVRWRAAILAHRCSLPPEGGLGQSAGQR